MSWADQPMLAFDVESTGVSVETDRIVTACVGRGGSDGWSARNWMLTQSEPIPQGAIDVHGVTTEHANEHGQDPRAALSEIRDAVYAGWADGLPVVAFNAVYDLTILDRNLRRNDLAPIEIRGPVLDGLVLDKMLDTYRKGSRRLTAVCEAYDLTLSDDDAHSAEPDARAAARLVWTLARKYPEIRALSLRDLHITQVSEYRKQSESFARYKASRGETVTDSHPAWPLRPLPTDRAKAA